MSSSEEDIPLAKLAKPKRKVPTPRKIAKKKLKTSKIASTDSSDEQPLVNLCEKSKSRNGKEVKPNKPPKMKLNQCSDSDDSNVALKSYERKIIDLRTSTNDSGNESLADDRQPLVSAPSNSPHVQDIPVAKPTEEKPADKSAESSTCKPTIDVVVESPILIKLKKYSSAAGFRCHYKKIFAQCQNNEQRIETLRNVFEEKGIKGPLSLDKCKQYRVRAQALQYLSMDNIIDEGKGRSLRKRGTPSFSEESESSSDEEVKQATHQAFERLKGIIDTQE